MSARVLPGAMELVDESLYSLSLSPVVKSEVKKKENERERVDEWRSIECNWSWYLKMKNCVAFYIQLSLIKQSTVYQPLNFLIHPIKNKTSPDNLITTKSPQINQSSYPGDGKIFDRRARRTVFVLFFIFYPRNFTAPKNGGKLQL